MQDQDAPELLSFSDAVAKIQSIKDRVAQVIFGQEQVIEEALCCLLSGGHILMTGAPGLAKTTLVRVISQSLGLEFGRVQFTPDLLPSDILGSDVLNVDNETGKRSFEFIPGPIFVNLLLADEINRASPRTQSALLEAMQERTVTIGTQYHRLKPPFMVFATQNPFESEGTFPLPEAQLDRFLIHTLVDYPSEEAEIQLLSAHAASTLVGEAGNKAETGSLATVAELLGLIQRTRMVHVETELLNGIAQLVRSTRPDDPMCPEAQRQFVRYGAGPRAGISLVSVCRAMALLEGSERVRWRHIRRLAAPVLRHRLRMTAVARREGYDEDNFIHAVLSKIETKYSNLAKGLE